jgi:hypothetical protein
MQWRDKPITPMHVARWAHTSYKIILYIDCPKIERVAQQLFERTHHTPPHASLPLDVLLYIEYVAWQFIWVVYASLCFKHFTSFRTNVASVCFSYFINLKRMLQIFLLRRCKC